MTDDRHRLLESVDAIHDEVGTQLASVDQRYTSRRRHLVGLLAEAGRPVTLPELLAMDPALPQSSVYRNLEVLERTGLVRRLVHGADHARYELAEPLLGHHHHLICVSCGMIEDVELDEDFEEQVDATLRDLAADAGFAPLHHSLDLHGHCASCTPGG